ncbi:MAG: type II toxin-antitoxin system RelB/DinJ family antitoxin [Paludibacteraceae bacterium]|nr:type II toxin-antitoxin system RelB/DinJ family antitoxin [Paludibacteraceae bacterium]
MALSTMTIRVDGNIKTQFDALCAQFGMSANAAMNVFINAVVRTRTIPFKISAEDGNAGQRALRTLYSTDRSNRPELTLEEINEEIRKSRRERKERQQKTTV